MSTPSTPQALANSSTTVYMGTPLKLRYDESSSTLQLDINGNYVDVWQKTVQYAFVPGQAAVTLYFTPLPGAGPITASYVVPAGTTVTSTQQSGSAVLTISRPPSIGVSFEILLEQGSLGFASAIAAPSPTQTASSPTRQSAVTSSRVAGIAASDGASPARGTTITPSAQLQTRLVLTTVEPPPDPDLGPKPESA